MTSNRLLTQSLRTVAGRGLGPSSALASMVCLQVGTAISVPLLIDIGPTSVTWLRLSGAAAMAVLLIRPRFARFGKNTVPSVIGLGAAMAGMSVFFAEAVSRIPLGIATGIEFLGPLGLAILSSRKLLDFVRAVLAGGGIVLLTRMGAGSNAPETFIGIICALLAAACWAFYIILTKRVGKFFAGLDGLALSLVVAALATSPFGLFRMQSNVAGWQVCAAVSLGVLVPLIPYGLEMMALRRMPARIFGIFASLDPAIAAASGGLILGDRLGWKGICGLALVVTASIGAIGLRGNSNRVPQKIYNSDTYKRLAPGLIEV